MHYELVKILSRALLLNPSQVECPYRTSSGRALARGIYAVLWPTSAAQQARHYDDKARYFGPFPSWRAASDYVCSLIDTGPARSRVESFR